MLDRGRERLLVVDVLVPETEQPRELGLPARAGGAELEGGLQRLDDPGFARGTANSAASPGSEGRWRDSRVRESRVAGAATFRPDRKYGDPVALPPVRGPQEGLSCLEAARGARRLESPRTRGAVAGILPRRSLGRVSD